MQVWEPRPGVGQHSRRDVGELQIAVVPEELIGFQVVDEVDIHITVIVIVTANGAGMRAGCRSEIPDLRGSKDACAQILINTIGLRRTNNDHIWFFTKTVG